MSRTLCLAYLGTKGPSSEYLGASLPACWKSMRTYATYPCTLHYQVWGHGSNNDPDLSPHDDLYFGQQPEISCALRSRSSKPFRKARIDFEEWRVAAYMNLLKLVYQRMSRMVFLTASKDLGRSLSFIGQARGVLGWSVSHKENRLHAFFKAHSGDAMGSLYPHLFDRKR